MVKAEDATLTQLQRKITRRQVIRAGGLAAVGLVFSKPLIETIHPSPAFASGGLPGPSAGCCPSSLPGQDVILAQRTHQLDIFGTYIGEAFVEVIGPAVGSSCCNSAITLMFGIRDIQNSWICNKLQDLVDQNLITCTTDGVVMPPIYSASNGICSVTRNVYFPVSCDSSVGCQCYYDESHTTTCTIPLYNRDIELQFNWSAYVSGSSQCEVEVSSATLPTSFCSFN